MFFRLHIILLFAIQQATFCLAQQITVTAGEDVTLPCTAVSAYPPWTGPEVYNGNKLNYNNPGSSNFANPRIPQQKKARLAWDSDNKGLIIKNVAVTDSGMYQCSAKQIDLVIVVPPRTPRILYAKPSSDNTLIIRASQSMKTKLVCVSIGGYPEPLVEWYRGNTRTQPLTSTTIGNMDSNSFNVTKTYTFTPERQDDGVKYFCQSSFRTEPRHTSTTHVGLVLNLKPDQPTVEQTSVVSAGNTVEVSCRTTGSRPAASITWSYRNTNPTGEVTSTLDDTTQTYTVVSLLKRPVTAEDNGQSVQCKVSHTLLVEPPQLTALVKLNVRFKPLTTTISGNNILIANGRNTLALTCTSGSSNPISDITWKISTEIIHHTGIPADQNGDYGGMKRSRTLTLTPTRDNDGDKISCEANNTVGTSKRSTVTLDLKYRPLIKPMSDVIAVEGNNTVLTCAASSKPASTFKWYRGGKSGILHQGTGTIISNKLAYIINNVRRTDAATYRCYADNGIETADNKNVKLTVYYPPDVTPVTTNTSVKSKTAVITCSAKGVPNINYRYGQWEQRWLGYDFPVSEKPGSEKLVLTNLTYEHSGVYTCSASNGITVFGTDKEFMDGSVHLLVKSFPIIANVNNKTPARLEENATVEVLYYSNAAGNEVNISRRNVNGFKQTEVVYTLSEANVELGLPVFTHTIKTAGIRARILLLIKTLDDLGLYNVVVSNEIGSSTRSFEVVHKGPPSKPYNVRVDRILYNAARLSWIRGYHGGFAQTFVIQFSTDQSNWRNVTVYGGKDESSEPVSHVLSGLHDSTTYYVQMYAFNIEGNSPYTEKLNYTTPSIKEKEVVYTQDSSALIVGVVLGVVIVVVVIYAIYVTILLKRKHVFTQKEGISEQASGQMYVNLTVPTKSNTNTTKKEERGKNTSADDTSPENQYTELNRQLRDQESAYEAISSM